jgi:predicted helicase
MADSSSSKITMDKNSGIKNDSNDWIAEHHDPAYLVNLSKRIARVSLETQKIVKTLPPLNERKVL